MSIVDNAPNPDRILFPDSLLTVASVEEATEIHCAIGVKSVLLHSPTAEGGCSCGKVHDKSPGGSTSIGKHPIQPHWQKKEPSFDDLRDQIARLRFTPNIGIVLGKQPGGEYLIAVDVDDAERFTQLEEEYGALPPTPRCDSGRGHRLFFSVPMEDELKNVTGLGSEPGSPKPGVDVKVEGGQVVVAPSLHANGKRYAWTVVGPVAPLPAQWLLQLLKKLEIPKSVAKYTPAEMSKPGRARNSGERYLEVAVNRRCEALVACGKGMRNNTLYNSACLMFEYCGGMHLSHKWQRVHDDLLRAALSAGLPETESRKTLASAERRVRESGKTKVPMVLAHPERTAAAPAKAPADDKWMLAPESQEVQEPAPQQEEPRKPVIRVTHEVFDNATESIEALRRDDDIYQRETKLVFVTRVSRDQSEGSDQITGDDGQMHRELVEGSPQICEMSTPTLRERLSKVASFQKWNNKIQEYVPFIPTDEIVGAVRKRAKWPGIRSLIGIVETPTLRPDGKIVQTPGYDRSTKYLYMPGESFPEVFDDRATQENARWAFQFLSECFEDFPYVSAAHRSVPIAAILTLVARPAILGSIPAVLFDASTRGSGKTLQTDAIATITTGRGAPRMNYTSDDVELEKILAGYALRGSSFICLDNIPGMRPFGGGPMDRVITARDDVELRILGATKIVTLPWRALIMATGNNISFHGDTSRRVIMARLEPTEEKPEQRTKFKHEDLLAWIRGQRPRLVSAALLILRAYFRAGCPNMGCTRWGSFEEWGKLIPPAIVFAGGADPMLARPEGEEEVDDQLRNIRTIMTWFRRELKDDEFKVSTVIELFFKTKRILNPMNGGYALDGYEDLRDAIEALVGKRGMKQEGRMIVPDPAEFGKRLAAFKGRVIAGLKLVTQTGAGGIMRWRVVPALTVVGTNISVGSRENGTDTDSGGPNISK
jgi:hypothetical protein